jgi:hypothetical protein
MNDHLIARCGRAGIQRLVERGLRDQREGVRLLLTPGWRVMRNEEDGSRFRGIGRARRSRGNARGVGIGSAPLRIKRLPRRGQGLHQSTMALDRLLHFGLSIDGAPGPHDALDVLRSTTAADGEQTPFRFWRRDAGQGPDLGVRQLAAREGLRQFR